MLILLILLQYVIILSGGSGEKTIISMPTGYWPVWFLCGTDILKAAESKPSKDLKAPPQLQNKPVLFVIAFISLSVGEHQRPLSSSHTTQQVSQADLLPLPSCT